MSLSLGRLGAMVLRYVYLLRSSWLRDFDREFHLM